MLQITISYRRYQQTLDNVETLYVELSKKLAPTEGTNLMTFGIVMPGPTS